MVTGSWTRFRELFQLSLTSGSSYFEYISILRWLLAHPTLCIYLYWCLNCFNIIGFLLTLNLYLWVINGLKSGFEFSITDFNLWFSRLIMRIFLAYCFMGISWVLNRYFIATLACCLCLKVSWVFHGYFMVTLACRLCLKVSQVFHATL